MDILIMIICCSVLLGFLVFIHEGGHYLASRAFGVRVTEFMLGFPGPSLSFKRGETRFGVTCVPLGGYAKVCGMEPGPMSPHLESVLAAMYRRGTANLEDIMEDCGLPEEDTLAALDELVEWGSLTGPRKTDKYNTYRAMEVAAPSARRARKLQAQGKPVPVAYEEGQARPVEDPAALFQSEYRQQYRSLPFWKRSVILLAGVAVNLVFALLAFVLIYSVLGFDYQYPSGEIKHVTIGPLQACMAGISYIGMVIQAVAGLFNPSTAAQVVSDSTSVVGIAVMTKTAFEQGLVNVLTLTAMLSTSLGIMNLLPIPPLDGGRFVVEIVQKITRRTASANVMGYLSLAGMVLFMGFFAIMLNQDIQRFIFGNWG
ncbi:MAG: site-2 protease family protein [Coriobacteriia bacterium]|nr:site-2 protease family protein [Coriobacteriia bacterium]